jgi:hypothetical protein
MYMRMSGRQEDEADKETCRQKRAPWQHKRESEREVVREREIESSSSREREGEREREKGGREGVGGREEGMDGGREVGR